MTKRDLETLEEGDIVRGKLSSLAYVIIHADGKKAIGIRAVEISQPDEWELISKTAPSKKTK